MALAPGDTLGPYEILALVGTGGMGEVYRARDARLNRDVAIKVSNTEFTERFTREARTIAALNHSNICHLYDVAPNYLVMEYVEGETLRGHEPARRAPDPPADHRRHRGGAREGHRPPRSQAGQHQGHARRRPIMGVDVRPDGSVSVPRRLVDRAEYFIRFQSYDVSPDGTRFLMIRRDEGSVPRQLNVILNWRAGSR